QDTAAPATQEPGATGDTDTPNEPTATDGETEAGDDAVAEFYEGKTITFIVGLSSGGSFDVLARLLAQHMGVHIPGNPDILVENMTGAGSMVAANHLANVAPADGTVAGTFLSSLINQELLETPGVEYAMADDEWLFAMGRN